MGSIRGITLPLPKDIRGLQDSIMRGQEYLALRTCVLIQGMMIATVARINCMKGTTTMTWTQCAVVAVVGVLAESAIGSEIGPRLAC